MSLFVAFFFIVLGLIGILIPWFPMVRTDVIQFILEDSLAIFLFGFCFVIIGLGCVFYIALNSRRHYYHVRSGPYAVQIDENLIQDYLETYWKQIFPHSSVPSRLQLKKNKIHLTADLPFIPPEEQKATLEKIKEDLSQIFASFLGYKQTFYLSASFQKEPKR